MKLWIDDVRPAPGGVADGWFWIADVDTAKEMVEIVEDWASVGQMTPIELIDIDHDAGEYAQYGGDYIKLLDWLEETGRNYPIRIHSQNVVGRMNMEAICRRNGWKIVE